MKHKITGFLYIVMLCSVLPGCQHPIVKWGKRCFRQSEDIPCDKTLVRQFIKQCVAYDQFDTIARFDALWLHDAVRTEYARLHAHIYGKSSEFYKALLRRQLEENKHFITFYVLSTFNTPLGDPESSWSVFLRVENVHIAPSEIKVIELLPEYKNFFDTHLTRFRVPYRVMFDAKNIEDEQIITNNTKGIDLVFRSSCKELVLHWDVQTAPVPEEYTEHDEPAFDIDLISQIPLVDEVHE
jgi:hypothetical protein